MENKRRGITHFLDGTKLTLEWPRQAPKDAIQFAASIRKAITAEQLPIEVEGRLLIIQMKNVKYVEVIPAPEKLPGEVLRNARLLASPALSGRCSAAFLVFCPWRTAPTGRRGTVGAPVDR